MKNNRVQRTETPNEVVNQHLEYVLPNDNSFYFFSGQQSTLSNQIKNILNNILREQPNSNGDCTVYHLIDTH